MNNVFSGWFQINTIKNYKIFRRPFKVNEQWFSKLYNKHYTKDIQSKFNFELFVDQDRGKARNIINEIKFNSSYISPYTNELTILSEWLEKFPIEYNELKDFLAGENIIINTASKQYGQLELLLNKIESIKHSVSEQKEILDRGISNKTTVFPAIIFEDYEYPYGFNTKKIDDYEIELKFINQNPSEEYPVAIVFRRQSEILNQIRNLKSFETELFFNKIKIIQGKAGMGKSNISAYLTNVLKNEKHPVILIKAKSFSGNPDEFNRILMEQLIIPNNYSIEEVLERINNYGIENNKRIALIFDGLNETTYANEGFSKIWEKSLDTFIELLTNYRFIYFIATLRTSYISRIWSNNQIPYSNFELKGFDESNLKNVVVKYFDHYKIGYEDLKEKEMYYFKTPLLIDLYCQMLNSKKIVGIQAVFGLSGFKDVFERYISKLSKDVKIKLTLGTVDQIKDGIDRCSNAMLENLEANIPLMKFYSLMQDENVVNVGGTIGDEMLSEYLIYLDENHKGRDVIIHTQQEVGGYLLASKLIKDYGTVDNVVNSDIFTNTIIGRSDQVHQLKDDILKFLLIEADENSNIFTSYIDNPIVKKFSIITLQTETLNTKTLGVQKILDGNLTSKVDISELISGLPSYLFEPQSPLNFTFIKSQLLKLDANTFEFTWTKLIYDEYIKIDSLVQRILDNEVVIEELENRDLIIDFLIWALETTIRELRDQITVILLDYFTKYPQLIFDKVLEYSKINKTYIYERLTSICYGVCLIEQNNEEFLNKILKENILSIYKLQFGVNPTYPTFNYIAIDSIKHIVDLGIYKGFFQLPENDIDDFKNYKFNIENWINIDEADIEIVKSIYLHWTLSDNPDPLRGDFVHYTIPRLEEREGNNLLQNTANIFKHILNLGYIQSETELSKTELKFKKGESLYGIKDKIDRLGKKYSWMAFFDYAGYLLNQGRLDVWRDDDSEFEKHYSRLGDVEIEITNPKQIIFSDKLYFDDLFAHKINHQDWVYKPMYHTVSELFTKDNFTMLSGFINQREDDSYDNRSFLLINSFFIKKDSVSGNIEDILNREFDWKNDVITSRGSMSKIYFGELYWADNIPTAILNHNDLPVEDSEESEHRITPFDIINYPEKYKKDDLNKSIMIIKKKRISFEVEPTLIDYSWESNSKIISTINSTIPSTNIGKQLKLRADTKSLQILDKENILAHKSFSFKENHYEQNFEYFRTDLLAEYMEQNGYLLVYQIKQHTYDRNSGDGTGDFRGMQFYLSTLNL